MKLETCLALSLPKGNLKLIHSYKATSYKLQATSYKLQATSYKLQATSLSKCMQRIISRKSVILDYKKAKKNALVVLMSQVALMTFYYKEYED